MNWVFIIALAAAVVAEAIPFIVTIIKYVKENSNERNWTNLVKLVFDLCMQAEEEFELGADKKEWVLSMLKATADSVGYDLSDTEMLEKVSNLIDSFISATKVINVD